MMALTGRLETYLVISTALFSLGIFGLLSRRNLISILISLELILNSASINFLAFNRFSMVDKSMGQTFVLFIIGLAAAEVCVALALILLLHRRAHTIDIQKINELKG